MGMWDEWRQWSKPGKGKAKQAASRFNKRAKKYQFKAFGPYVFRRSK